MHSSDLRSLDPRRILVMRCLRGLGDMLCAVPALRALRAGLPDAQIDLLGLDSSAPFAARFGKYVDELVEFTGFPGIPELPPNAHLLPRFLADVQSRRYDVVIQMHGDGSVSNQLAVALGAAATAGFYRPGAYLPDPRLFLPYPDDLREPVRLLTLTSFLGIEPMSEHLEFPMTPEERREARDALESYGVASAYAIVNPGAQDPRRRWPAASFAAVGDELAAAGLRVLLTGTLAEVGLTRRVAGLMRAPAVDLAGRTSIGALGALIGSARLLLTNDSGPSHLAAALRTPSVVVFTGASDPVRWAPGDGGLHRWLPPPASADEVRSQMKDLLGQEVARVPTGVA